MHPPIEYSLYLVLGTVDCLGRDPLLILEEAIQGGVSIVQLREKEMATRDMVDLARAMKRVLDENGLPLIINDRVDVALAVGAAGVHVGQEDMHPLDARALIGPDRLLGLSVNNQAHLREALTLPVDYLGIGPVFPTETKKDAQPALGLDGLRALLHETGVPAVGIGGINAQNAAQVIAAGAQGVALVSAVCGAPSPLQAAQALRARIDAAR